MASGSARPRIESVAEFVLTVDEPPALECLTFDADVGPPTYTIVGSDSYAGDGPYDLVLSDDALVTTEDDSYVLFVAILTTEYGAGAGGNHTDTWTISDDSAEATPSYLQLDGSDCFNGSWKHKALFDGGPFSPQDHACVDTPPEILGKYYAYTGLLGYRAMTNALPAGTTITIDTGNVLVTDLVDSVATQVVAVLVKNMAPYTSVQEGIDGSYEVDAYDEGGALFTFSAGTNNEHPPEGSCSFFEGIKSSGSVRECAEGDDLLADSNASFTQNWHPTDGPPCFCSENTAVTKAKITVTMIPAASGTYAVDLGTLDIGFDIDTIGGFMLPGQGFY